MGKAFSEMTTEELQNMIEALTNELKKRTSEEPEKNKVLLNPEDYFERYNGGWCKSITSLDKTVTTGYSIVGEFKPKKTDYYIIGDLYLDCGIGGSRKNILKEYKLFTINEEAEVIIIATLGNTKSWATDLWEHIDNYNNSRSIKIKKIMERMEANS